MKISRAIAAIAFLAAVSVFQVAAQQPRPGTPPAGPATSANVPDSKIALIDSSVFADEKQGIVRLLAAIKRVETEFQPLQTELQTLKTALEKATADFTKVAPMQDPKLNQQQQDKLEQMDKELKRKAEDGQTRYQNRIREVLTPIQDEIGKALDTFAKARGITLVLDVTRFQGIVSAADSLDITKAFIIEFNAKNPVTAALTPK